MVRSFSFYSFIFLRKGLISRKALGEKVWKSAKTILPFSCCPLVFSDINKIRMWPISWNSGSVSSRAQRTQLYLLKASFPLNSAKTSDVARMSLWSGRFSKEGYWGRSKRGRGKRRNSCAIVQLCSTIAQLLRNSCASKPLKTRGSAWQPASFGNYCVAFYELLLRNYCVSSRDPFYSDPNTPPINFQVPVCGVTFCRFSRHPGDHKPKCL